MVEKKCDIQDRHTTQHNGKTEAVRNAA